MLLGASGPAPEVLACATTYAAELDTLKSWIGTRLTWLDANIPGVCMHVGSPEIAAAAGFTCFPNPTEGRVHFRGTLEGEGPWELSINDLAWREVQRVRLDSGTCDLDLDMPDGGTYIYALRSAGRVVWTERVVVY